MRRALLREWPALTKFYGLRPFDLERLTIDELNEYRRQYGEHVRQIEKLERDSKRRASSTRRRR